MDPTVPTRRPRLLLMAYSCCPGFGSEPGVGWNRAVEAAKHFDTWVICESWSAENIRRYEDIHGRIPGLHVVSLPHSPWLERLPESARGFYFWYNLWQRGAYRVARQLHDTLHFDLVHHVTLNGYREPGYAYRLGVPFVWGPVGGTQNFPWRFLGGIGLVAALREALRGVVNVLQLRLDPRVGRAARNASVLLAANTTVQKDFQRTRRIRATCMLETGITRIAETPAARDSGGPLRILWSGSLIPRKALHLLLAALGQLPRNVSYELRVMGDGPLAHRWRRLARRSGVQRHTTWLGQLSHADALACFGWADVFVFTSLRDTSGNVVLEALAAGRPVICLDHQGVADIVTPECGVKIPVTTPRQVVARLAETIASLAADPSRLAALGEGARARARQFLWPLQGDRMHAVYRQALGTPSGLNAAAATRMPGRLRVVRNRLAATAGHRLGALLGERQHGGIGIFMYHGISPPAEGRPLPPGTVSPRRFRSQLEGLLAAGYQAWPLRKVLEHHATGRPFPPRVFALSFDDGYENFHTHAWPLLKELDLPATLFVPTAYLDGGDPMPFGPQAASGDNGQGAKLFRPLATAQCAEMLGDGCVELGSHGHVHGDFRGRPEAFRADLLRSLEELRTRFGLTGVGYAFPFGFCDAAMVETARRVGVLYALTTSSELVRPRSDRLAWGRFEVCETDTAAILAGKLGGWYSLARDAWLRLRRSCRVERGFADAGCRGAQEVVSR